MSDPAEMSLLDRYRRVKAERDKALESVSFLRRVYKKTLHNILTDPNTLEYLVQKQRRLHTDQKLKGE